MNISNEQKQWIKATIPVLEQGGEALTTHFYKLMFSKYPVTAQFFNPAHQAKGTQPRALANAVLAYAKHIDDLSPLLGAVNLIVHKHVALGVRAEHYPIVGECLLQAMREVLGEAATPDILDAWGAAYGQLANLLIDAESRLYASNSSAPGGWQGKRSFKVVRKQAESELVTSFYLEPVDGKPVLAHKPGQYITVYLQANGQTIPRNYSLSQAANGRDYRISVKREPNGVASNHLHEQVQVGDTLELAPPCGEFVLNDAHTPVVLVTAGVGITPAISMLQAAAGKRPVHFVHACKNAAQHSFKQSTEQIAQTSPDIALTTVYENEHGLLSKATLAAAVKQDADVYFLGPVGFMKSVKQMLDTLNVPASRQHFEFFGPAQALA